MRESWSVIAYCGPRMKECKHISIINVYSGKGPLRENNDRKMVDKISCHVNWNDPICLFRPNKLMLTAGDKVSGYYAEEMVMPLCPCKSEVVLASKRTLSGTTLILIWIPNEYVV